MLSQLLFAITLAFAAPADPAGASDHPLLHRYEGSWILGYRQSAFDSLSLPLAAPAKTGSAWSLPKQQDVEGRRTRLLYVAPDARTPLEVYRNYADALRGAGFVELFSCAESACGGDEPLVRRFLYAGAQQLDTRGQPSTMAFSQPSEPRYLAAKLSRPEGDVYVSLFVARENFAGFKEQTWNRTLTLIDIVETAPMEAGKVTVDADALGRDLISAGRAALYGVSFDTGSATLRPESQPTLAEIARLLGNKPELKLYVVGHTDDVGEMKANLDLSWRRAEAVVQALVSQYKVDPGRLTAEGVGPLAPVAPNTSEQGRALNRRVELVPR